MHFFAIVSTVLSLLAIINAQNNPSSSNSTSPNYGLNPSSVDIGTRQYWCQQQQAQCPLICADINNNDQTTIQNSCDANSLSFQCVCGNNQSPNATQYTQTIPYYECTTAGDQCVAACPQGDGTCQSNCRNSRPCGATAPKHYNQTTTKASSSAAPTSTGPSINGPGSGAASLSLGPGVGMLGLLGLVTAGFAVLL